MLNKKSSKAVLRPFLSVAGSELWPPSWVDVFEKGSKFENSKINFHLSKFNWGWATILPHGWKWKPCRNFLLLEPSPGSNCWKFCKSSSSQSELFVFIIWKLQPSITQAVSHCIASRLNVETLLKINFTEYLVREFFFKSLIFIKYYVLIDMRIYL